MSDISTALEIHLREYEQIKVEQVARIAFRDNLIYVTLVAYGAIFAFAVKDNNIALLILPWVSVILGWGYLVNDEKVSSIGRYVRLTLSIRIAALLKEATPEELFGWEIAHRSDPRRRRRKIEQLVIDEVTFVCSGFAALIAYCVAVPDVPWMLKTVVGFEFFLLVMLGIEIALYADLKSGR